MTRYLIGVSACALLLSGEAYAQSVEPTDNEILVTARKRDERLQDTPLAITAISGNALETRQIQNIAQIGQSVPNMTFQSGSPTGTGSSTPSIYIRGVGSNETSLGTEPGVGLYVDDVYLARSVGSVLDLVDVDSIQVLRGPQGTLFGRNSVGGALLIRSKRPTSEFEGAVRLQTGTDNRAEAKAMLNIPFGEAMRSRWSFLAARQDGYVRSTEGDDFGNTNRVAGRGTIELEPASNLLLTLRLDGLRAREAAAPTQVLGFVATIPGTPVPSKIQAIANLKGTCGGASVLLNSGNPDCIDQQVVLGPFRTAGGYRATNPIFESQGSQPFGNTTNLDIYGGSFHVEWRPAEGMQVKSVTSYRSLKAFWVGNSDHSANEAMETKNDLNQSQFTQEIQFGLERDRLDLVVGGFYMRERGTFLNAVMFPDVIFRSGGKFRTQSAAAFAQGSYKLTDQLELTAGLRYTHEIKNYTVADYQQVIGVLVEPATRTFLDLRATPIPFVTGTTPEIRQGEATPHLNLAFQPDRHLLFYASYSKGYKSGGYEQRLAPGTPVVPTFRPEYVDSFEIGAKIATVDGRLQANIAAFRSNYDDMQISVVDGPAPTLTNAGGAVLKGAEIELSLFPSGMTSATAYASYLDAHYDQLSTRAAASGVSLNSRLPNTPRWQFGANVTQTVIETIDLKLVANAEWNYRSEVFLDAQNTPLLRQGGYGVVNAGIAAEFRNRSVTIHANVRNLLDRHFLVTGLAQYDIGQIEGQYARPREWTLGVSYKF